MVTKVEEVRRSKMLSADCFQYKFTEAKFDHWKAKHKKNVMKTELEISNHIQKCLRKFTTEPTSGEVWQEDFNAVFADVIDMIKNTDNL
jgi:hypothetical protein